MPRQSNTTDSNMSEINENLHKKTQELEMTRREIGQHYKEEEKVSVMGSPMYRPYFGNNMSISINGVLVTVPLDGQSYKIPDTFAAEFMDRLSKVDEQIRIRRGLANVSENVESFVGEKDLISRG